MTGLPSVALKVGANRVLRGTSFSHPCGNPALGSREERAWRVGLVRAAVEALRTRVEGPTLFESEGAATR